MTDTDRALLGDLDRFGFLTTNQLQLLHFSTNASELAAARRTYRALTRLAQLGVVEHLDRRVGGVRAGSASYVWRVGPVGHRLLLGDTAARLRRKEPSLRTLDHRLAVADAAVRLTLASRAGSFELLKLTTEPDSWQSFLGPGAVRQVLKPDAFAVTAIDDYEDYWYLEIDRATESLPTIVRKSLQYARYVRTGDAVQRYGVNPLVVWLVPDEKRKQAIENAIATSDLDLRLFRFAVQDAITALIAGGAG
ncbi:replication-relaxation family protein [Jatrophihabitans endophyticus]|nr:replication-relaxation family protein [Jatrophihabitans endophyticus]